MNDLDETNFNVVQYFDNLENPLLIELPEKTIEIKPTILIANDMWWQI